jgi:hypothetical protein
MVLLTGALTGVNGLLGSPNWSDVGNGNVIPYEEPLAGADGGVLRSS